MATAEALIGTQLLNLYPVRRTPDVAAEAIRTTDLCANVDL